MPNFIARSSRDLCRSPSVRYSGPFDPFSGTAQSFS